jgi:hypothetical protein
LPSLRIVTVLPASAVPVKVGVVTLVTLSVLEAPLSDAAARSGADGADGAVASIVTWSVDDVPLELLAVIRCTPSASAEAEIV